MKSLAATTMMLLIFVMTVSAQKKYSKEEKTIIDFIQQHYDHWKNREYDKWTETWVHEDYVRYVLVAPNFMIDRNGWKEVSEQQKNFIDNNPEAGLEVDFSQFDYDFVIRDNIAIVRFDGENSLRTTSVFEKINGTWKYISNEQINKPYFDVNREKNRLARFEGDWQMIPGSFRWENSDNKGEVTRYEMNICRSLTGAEIKQKISFKNPQQIVNVATEDISIIINSPTNELMHRAITSWPNGWTVVADGPVQVTGKSIEFEGTNVGSEENTYTGTIERKSTDLLSVSWKFASGEKWSADMKLSE